MTGPIVPDERASLPVDSPKLRRLPPLLRRAWYGLNQAFRRRIAHLGVTPDQFTALRTIQEGDPKGLTQRDLTVAMSSDPNTIASLLERMEALGWVERRRHETDRRAHRILILEAGMKKYLDGREIAVQLQTEILSVLPLKNQDEFLEDLGVIAKACRKAAQNSPTKKKVIASTPTEPTETPAPNPTAG